MNLDEFNGLSEDEAKVALERCCGSALWVEEVARLRPFRSERELFDTADRIWRTLSLSDWKEAFAHHPKIGDLNSIKAKFQTTASWATQEQAGVRAASESTLRALSDGNRTYEEKFGYIFIVCATEKNEREMLELLKARMGNSPSQEIVIAAEEQAKITRIRLEKLFQLEI